MMKEDDFKDIRDKLSDYEVEAPQDLWARIDSAVSRRQRHSLWLRVGRYAAAAAVISAVVIGIRLFQPSNTSEVPDGGIGHNTTARAHASTDATVDVVRADETEKYNTTSEVRASDLSRTAYASRAQATFAKATPSCEAVVLSTPAETESEDNSTPSVGAESADVEMIVHSLPSIQSPKSQSRAKTYSGKQHNERQHQEPGRLAASIYTTAGTGGTSMQRYTSFGLMGIAPNDANWKEDPHMGMLVTNQGHISDRRVRHRLPVHAGVSAAYRISSRVSIEAGIAYSYLSADIQEGSDSYYFAGDQSLHYIGIPVSVRLRAVSWKNFDVYVGAGFEAEKCVSGTLKKAYVINGQTRDDGHENISIRPLQWSVNATAGAQYNISPSVGIYVEPGLSYYFDNGTDIETIYSEKPLNFNLNIGLRISFGSR